MNTHACRICLGTKWTKSICLDEEGGWIQLLEYCVGVFINKEDVPRMLCSKCAEDLQKYAEFKMQCHKADTLWKSFVAMNLKCYSETPKYNNNCSDINLTANLLQTETDLEHKDFASNQTSSKTENDDFKDKYVVSTTKVSQCDMEHFDVLLYDSKNINNVYIKLEKDVGNENTEETIIDLNGLPKCNNSKRKYSISKWLQKPLNFCQSKKTSTNKRWKKPPCERLIQKPLTESTCHKCGLCDYSSSDSVTLNQHLDEHMKNKDLKCKKCDFIGKDISQTIVHRYSHQENQQKLSLLCHICGLRKLTSLSLQFHYRVKHLDLKNGGLCSVCDKVFKNFKSWKDHERLHREHNYVCDHCGQRFLYKNTIVAHMAGHSNIKEYVCEECGKAFKRAFGLFTHIEGVHRKQERIKCSHCPKTFKNPSTFKIHMRQIASKDKWHKCDVCSKSFPTASILKKHAFFHTGERPFCCHMCGSRYKSKANLKVHMRNHTGDMPFKCVQCEKSFPSSSQLKVHTSVHTGVRRHKCRHCERSFHSNKALKEHMISHNNTNVESET